MLMPWRGRSLAERSTVRRRRPPTPPAAALPIARVRPATALPHLDRDFDYEVPATLDSAAQPGAAVRIRFAGRLLDGWIMERTSRQRHPGPVSRLHAVPAALPLLTPSVMAAVHETAAAFLGTFGDVARAAVPPRHARSEGQGLAQAMTHGQPPTRPRLADGSPPPWPDLTAGPALLRRLAAHQPVLAALTWPPGWAWPLLLRDLLLAVPADSGVLVIAPDARDVEHCAQALADVPHTRLTSDLGPATRYGQFLRIRLGLSTVVIGTRAAAFAPVARLALIVVLDDSEDLHTSPQAPYWSTGAVARIRARVSGAALVLASAARSVSAQWSVEHEGFGSVGAPRVWVRRHAPRVRFTGETGAPERDTPAGRARIPPMAMAAARVGLAEGAVLVSVPRRGYRPALACQRCRAPARCPRCGRILAGARGQSAPECRGCGGPAASWRCPRCGGEHVRALIVGAERTAEEFGRAFPGHPLVLSAGGSMGELTPHSAVGALVIATPGAEPDLPGGYAAALILDASETLARPVLAAGEQALLRWLTVARAVRPGGSVIVVGREPAPEVAALVRWDPVGWAAQVLAERAAAQLPPTTTTLGLRGGHAEVAHLLGLVAHLLGPDPATSTTAEAGVRTYGPVPEGESSLGYVVVPPGLRSAAAAVVGSHLRHCSARGEPRPSVRVDPPWL